MGPKVLTLLWAPVVALTVLLLVTGYWRAGMHMMIILYYAITGQPF